MKNLTHALTYIALVFIVIVWAVLMFWWLFPYKTSTQTQPYKVLTPVVEQGGFIQYEIDYCKYTDRVPEVDRQFVDGIIYAVPRANVQIKKGCGLVVNSIKVPDNLPAAEYHLNARVRWRVNPIRTITEEYITEKFLVVDN